MTEIKREVLTWERFGVATRELDGERLDVESGTFDAVISRVGLIYFPDQQAALTGMRDALRPGGRISAVVYSTADRNGFGFFRRPYSLSAQGWPPFYRRSPLLS